MKALVGLALALAAGVCAARNDPWFLVLSDVNADCVRVTGTSAPAYPVEAAESEGGVVRVRLAFSGTTAPPDVEVFTNTAGEAFARVVREHVAGYRLGCPDDVGRRTVLTQEFQFVPDRQRLVLRGGYQRSTQQAQRSLEACERVVPPAPDYPSSRVRTRGDNENGAALIRVTFNGPDLATAELRSSGGGQVFEQIALDHAKGYRLRCADPTAYPVVATIPYAFRMPGSNRYEFRPTTLKDFLGAVQGLDAERVRFDFTTMGCPFKVQYRHWSPPSGAHAASDRNFADERREFLSWLSRLRLQTTGTRMQQDLLGEAVAIDIPCVTLNLL